MKQSASIVKFLNSDPVTSRNLATCGCGRRYWTKWRDGTMYTHMCIWCWDVMQSRFGRVRRGIAQ